MMPQSTLENLGEPDLKVGGFQLWIHGWECHGARNPYDADWLRVTAHCGMSGASVRISGAIVMASDIKGFGEECDRLWREGKGTAILDPFEPELCLELERADSLGHLTVRVDITPDNLTQSHAFKFEIDQSYLPAIVKQCSAICEKYPVRIPYPKRGNQT